MKQALSIITLLLLSTLAHAGVLKPYEGAPLPDFTLSDLGGTAHTLSNYKGKVVMVNFWATYCGPCIKEMPSMQRLKEKMGGKPFEILAVDLAEDQPAIEAFLQRHQIKVNFPILVDPLGSVLEKWMVSAVPTTFIVDPQGKIRYALFGGLEWDSAEVVETLNGLMK